MKKIKDIKAQMSPLLRNVVIIILVVIMLGILILSWKGFVGKMMQ
jgi:hypothetical protein|tara:strand:+ start:390 stop:524 length:135 start_codon:yes stop_codon:yes gene_type:complete